MEALIRDGYKCVLTGKYDTQAIDIPYIDDETIFRVGAVDTRCAHIAPESTYFTDFEHPNSPEKVNPYGFGCCLLVYPCPDTLLCLILGSFETFWI